MLKGSVVAIVTPFKDNRVDEDALRGLIEFQIANGTHGILPCGTTGESPTLSHAEHQSVIELTVNTVNKRTAVVAGTGSNSTEEAVALTRFAQKVGADASLLITPYYNRPTQEGLYQHFKAVADNADIPIILYNVPSRTGVNLQPQTILRLRTDCGNIIGVKEASGSLSQASKILSLCGKDFFLFSGEDALNFPVLAIGGRGFITVTANVAPKKVAELYNRFEAGDIDGARDIHYELLSLNETLFLETNPVPVKRALALMGKIELGSRLPLCEMSKANLDKLRQVLKSYDLIP